MLAPSFGKPAFLTTVISRTTETEYVFLCIISIVIHVVVLPHELI